MSEHRKSMTPQDKIIAAGMTPCQDCTWVNGNVRKMCARHTGLLIKNFPGDKSHFPPSDPRDWQDHQARIQRELKR